MIGLHFQETCIGTKLVNYLNISTFRTQKCGRFSVRAIAIKILLELVLRKALAIKYFLTEYFIESY